LWGASAKDVLAKEKVESVLLKQNNKGKKIVTFKGNYQYTYNVDEYSFVDTLENLGEFTVTYYFLKNKLFKASYIKEFKTIKIIKKSNEPKGKVEKIIDESDNNFEKMKQYLIWKYGNNYKTYGLNDNFEWNTMESKIVLNLYSGRNYSVEYYANTEIMKDFIDNAENGKEFIKELESEFREFNKIKEKI